MKIKMHSKLSALFIIMLFNIVLMACGGSAPTREGIVANYPDVEQGSARLENTDILCPFVRMMERSGFFDEEVASKATLSVSVSSVNSAAEAFGCTTALACGPVTTAVANGQGTPGMIDLEKLEEAEGIAHECGFTFAFGGTFVDDTVRQATLDRLSELSDVDGNIVYADIETVQLEICASQGVQPSSAGVTEAKLIFAYLGGVENGSIAVSDVDRLLHATMPEVKTTSWINAFLLGRVN